MENHKMVESVHVREEEDNDAAVQEEEDEADVGSSLTLERVAAAKKFIEDHYRSQMKHIRERKERCVCEIHALSFLLFNVMLRSFLFRYVLWGGS